MLVVLVELPVWLEACFYGGALYINSKINLERQKELAAVLLKDLG